MERLALYNLPKRLSQAITIGQQIAITNPYMRVAGDGKPMIRVDDPASVQLLEKVAICHFCSQQAAKLLCCGKCRSALYCRYTSGVSCTPRTAIHARLTKKCSSLCAHHTHSASNARSATGKSSTTRRSALRRSNNSAGVALAGCLYQCSCSKKLSVLRARTHTQRQRGLFYFLER